MNKNDFIETYLSHADDYDCEKKIRNLLIGHKIVDIIGNVDDNSTFIVLDNAVALEIFGNQGRGGFLNGWYFASEIANLKDVDNVITNVELSLEYDDKSGDDLYKIFVFFEDKKINLVTYSGHDNGYQGTGYSLFVREAKKIIK